MVNGQGASRTVVKFLGASLTLNCVVAAIMGIWIYKKGGLRYVGEQIGIGRTVHDPTPWQIDWRKRNDGLPNTDGEIVFLGDSITASMPWGEFYSAIRNRGIGGDTADGVLQRLDEVTESKPTQVFLNIGTNDLARETTTRQVIDDIVEIVRRIKMASPNTKIFVCSILPVNLRIESNLQLLKKQQQIRLINSELRDLQDAARFRFVDLTAAFSDSNGYLHADWTTDGLHLNGEGKRQYCLKLLPLVDTPTAQALVAKQLYYTDLSDAPAEVGASTHTR